MVSTFSLEPLLSQHGRALEEDMMLFVQSLSGLLDSQCSLRDLLSIQIPVDSLGTG